MACSGGVRFWGAATQIEPVCSYGKQKRCNESIITALSHWHNCCFGITKSPVISKHQGGIPPKTLDTFIAQPNAPA